MGRSLVRHRSRHDATLEDRRHHLGDVADEPDREGLARVHGLLRPGQRAIEIVRDLVAVPGLDAPLDTCLVDLDRQADPAVHRHGERLGAAHPPQARRDHESSREGSPEVLPAHSANVS